MSHVTNVMLSCPLGEYDNRDGADPDAVPMGPALAAMSAYCEATPSLGRLPEAIDSVSAGTKCMGCLVYAWGANSFDPGEFLGMVATMPWEYPEDIQVFLRGEEDERWALYNLKRDRSWD